MHLSDVLQLGDPRLYEICEAVKKEETVSLKPIIDGLANVVLEFREKYKAGRAIAAPQVGVMKRLVVMNIDQPIAMFNPVLINKSDEMMELWDDCMSFPNLLVKVKRHRYCTLKFRDMNWEEQTWELKDDLSELLQHEVDHLDGILATQRAIDDRSFKFVHS